MASPECPLIIHQASCHLNNRKPPPPLEAWEPMNWECFHFEKDESIILAQLCSLTFTPNSRYPPCTILWQKYYFSSFPSLSTKELTCFFVAWKGVLRRSTLIKFLLGEALITENALPPPRKKKAYNRVVYGLHLEKSMQSNFNWIVKLLRNTKNSLSNTHIPTVHALHTIFRQSLSLYSKLTFNLFCNPDWSQTHDSPVLLPQVLGSKPIPPSPKCLCWCRKGWGWGGWLAFVFVFVLVFCNAGHQTQDFECAK